MLQQEHIKKLYKNYISLIIKDIELVYKSLTALLEQGSISKTEVEEIEFYIDYAAKYIDQIEKRIFNVEKIPHIEKIFSIFESDTEWICKGKSGIKQELGLNVCIVTDRVGFILHHKVMRKTTDVEIAVPIIRETREMYPGFTECSFDKGFHSPGNQIELRNILDKVILPRKGKLTLSRRESESRDFFVEARKHHPAVESSIAALKNHGLECCPDKGSKAFDRYISLGILSRNIQHLGHLIQMKHLKAQQKQKKNLQTRKIKRKEQRMLLETAV